MIAVELEAMAYCENLHFCRFFMFLILSEHPDSAFLGCALKQNRDPVDYQKHVSTEIQNCMLKNWRHIEKKQSFISADNNIKICGPSLNCKAETALLAYALKIIFKFQKISFVFC